jgi:hypothetical protein
VDLDALNRLPGAWRLRKALRRLYNPHHDNPFLTFAAPGHFYSPLPDLRFVERHKDALFDRTVRRVPGIEMNDGEQLAIVGEIAAYYAELPFEGAPSPGRRYYFDNPYFTWGDAIILYGMLRHFKPCRVIEVGSGYSSAVMLDTNDLFMSPKASFTFIEPYPARLYSLLSDDDRQRHQVLEKIVQEVPVGLFSALEANDILFIDSSHVAKVGSDVVHLLTHVLPALANGVIVHFHDVFWPFEYPEHWVREGRAWNENYVLKAFLQFNSAFKILCFNSYLATHFESTLQQKLPLFLRLSGGSLWLQKTL